MINGALVTSYDGSVVELSNGTAIPAATLIWTAGAKPSPVIEGLPCEKQRGRLLVNERLAVAGVPGLWAVGDCAAVPDGSGGFYRLPRNMGCERQSLRQRTSRVPSSASR